MSQELLAMLDELAISNKITHELYTWYKQNPHGNDYIFDIDDMHHFVTERVPPDVQQHLDGGAVFGSDNSGMLFWHDGNDVMCRGRGAVYASDKIYLGCATSHYVAESLDEFLKIFQERSWDDPWPWENAPRERERLRGLLEDLASNLSAPASNKESGPVLNEDFEIVYSLCDGLSSPALTLKPRAELEPTGDGYSIVEVGHRVTADGDQPVFYEQVSGHLLSAPLIPGVFDTAIPLGWFPAAVARECQREL